MAKKFCATIITLFCLVTLSLAGTQPQKDEAAAKATDATPMLRLTDDPVKTETESNAAAAAVTTAPLTKITFHPINRRFDVRSKHPCRHHHFRVFPSMRRENEQIPYGNDMIVSSGESSDFEDPAAVIHGEGRRIRGRWVKLHHHHHHHDEDSDSDDDDEGEDRIEKKLKVLKKLKKHFGHQYHHHHHQIGEIERKKKEGSSFMKRVREFLDHYF